MRVKTLLLGILFSAAFVAMGQDIKLPEPALNEDASLKESLEKRCSSRDFVYRPFDLQTISNLLWSGWGYNRDDKRTAPSALDKQEVTLYVCTKDGVYIYDANENMLVKVSGNNIVKSTGKQPFVEKAAINILYVSDLSKGVSGEMTAVCCGAISQNMALYCASVGLGSVVRGSFDADELRRLLNLPANLKVVLAQSVGFIE